MTPETEKELEGKTWLRSMSIAELKKWIDKNFIDKQTLKEELEKEIERISNLCCPHKDSQCKRHKDDCSIDGAKIQALQDIEKKLL